MRLAMTAILMPVTAATAFVRLSVAATTASIRARLVMTATPMLVMVAMRVVAVKPAVMVEWTKARRVMMVIAWIRMPAPTHALPLAAVMGLFAPAVKNAMTAIKFKPMRA